MHEEVRDWFGANCDGKYLEAFVCDSVLAVWLVQREWVGARPVCGASTWGWTGGRGRAWMWSAW